MTLSAFFKPVNQVNMTRLTVIWVKKTVKNKQKTSGRAWQPLQPVQGDSIGA